VSALQNGQGDLAPREKSDISDRRNIDARLQIVGKQFFLSETTICHTGK